MGITGTAALDLVDGGEYSDEADGRIRGSEIVAGLRRPKELFELAGTVEAFLSIAVSIGIDLGFWKIEKTVFERELARITLFEFQIGGGGGGGSPVSSFVADTGSLEPAGASSALQSAEAPVIPAEPVALPLSDEPLLSSDAWIVFIEGPEDGRLLVPTESATQPAVPSRRGVGPSGGFRGGSRTDWRLRASLRRIGAGPGRRTPGDRRSPECIRRRRCLGGLAPVDAEHATTGARYCCLSNDVFSYFTRTLSISSSLSSPYRTAASASGLFGL